MATKPFLLVMNKYQYDPISPVQISPSYFQSGAVTSSGTSIATPSGAVMSGYGDDSLATAGLGDNESFSGGGASLFAAIGSLVSSIFNYFSQKKLQKQQQQFQKEYFDYTFGKQSEEKWKEIYYNDPWRQMQRLKDAGLNENLMYGTLGNVAQASGVAPANSPSGLSGSIPTVAPFFDFASPIQALLSPMQAMSQIGLNKSQAFKNYKSGGLDDVEANRRSLLTPYEVQKMDEEIKNLMQMRVYYESLTANEYNKNTAFDIYQPFIRDFYENQLEEIKMRNSESYSRIMLNAWQSQQIQESIARLLPSQVQLNSATAKERLAAAYQIYSLTPEQKKEIAARAGVTMKQYEYFVYNNIIGPLLLGGIAAGAKLGATAMLLP